VSSKPPSLSAILAVVHALLLPVRERDPRGRKPEYSDELMVALVIFERAWGFSSSKQMLALLASTGENVPAEATFCERKQKLTAVILAALKQFFASGLSSVRLHLDSKKLPICSLGRAKRTQLPGARGIDIANQLPFFGLRLHTLVDDSGRLADVRLRPANVHDVKVAPELLKTLRYKVVTADKGYVSAPLRRRCSLQTVDFITKRRSNQLPNTVRERRLMRCHRRVETVFSQLDRLGLSHKVHVSTTGLYVHILAVLLAYCVLTFIRDYPSIVLAILKLHLFPNLGKMFSKSNFADPTKKRIAQSSIRLLPPPSL
jgi:hypothetical protein